MSNSQVQTMHNVKQRIAPAIIDFCNSSLKWDTTFAMEELRKYIRLLGYAVAPDTPGRILRQLRSEGVIDYVVVNRAKSEYYVKSVNA